MSVIAVHYNTYMTWKERSQFFEQIRQRIAAMPEVVSAGISTKCHAARQWMEHQVPLLQGCV
jgi:hypothetical protein